MIKTNDILYHINDCFLYYFQQLDKISKQKQYEIDKKM